MARVFAREAALQVAAEGEKLVVGGGGIPQGGLAEFETAANLPEIRDRMRGLVTDMDRVADIVYERN